MILELNLLEISDLIESVHTLKNESYEKAKLFEKWMEEFPEEEKENKKCFEIEKTRYSRFKKLENKLFKTIEKGM